MPVMQQRQLPVCCQLKLNMNVPKVQLLTFQELGSAVCPEDETIVGIYLEVQGDIDGSMMFLMHLDSAHFLVNRLMGREADFMADFDEMDMSALKEIGNIIAGSYLNALSSMTNLVISPSVPYIAIDMAAAILSVPAIPVWADWRQCIADRNRVR